jgi:hypothetical protein
MYWLKTINTLEDCDFGGSYFHMPPSTYRTDKTTYAKSDI